MHDTRKEIQVTRKDYEKAADIARDLGLIRGHGLKWRPVNESERAKVVDAFVRLFKGDNPRFQEEKFRFACQPDTTYRNRSRAA
jgi:hypothetical protein